MSEETTKDRILAAALAAFADFGYEAATIADIRRRSGISTGSIYHHYGSKEAIAGALYVEGIRRYQAGFAAALQAGRTARAAVRRAIAFHLDWVADNPDWARFILGHARPEWLNHQGEALAAHNDRFRTAVTDWFAARVADGDIRKVPLDVAFALLIGAPQFLVRAWAAGRSGEIPRGAAEQLAEAAWRALEPDSGTKPKQTSRRKRR